MVYTTLTIGGNEYKLRLTAAKMIEVEKALGNNPVNMLMKMANTGEVPKMSDVMTIFWGSLTHYQHGVTKEQAYGLYDQYIADGGTYQEFITDVIIAAFKSAGFIQDEPEENSDTEGDTKND